MPRSRPAFDHIVVAIDGPAGAGKTTVARGVAKALGIAHLDTGSMYRALTARALAEGVDLEDERTLAALARRMRIEFSPAGMLVDGRPVGRALRSPAVNRSVSVVAAHPAVRRELVRVQRQIMRAGDIVAEGRDIGTVVYPNATVKVFLTASAAERARRRHEEMVRAGEEIAFDVLRRQIARRDAIDTSRAASPLAPAPDARILDTTGKTPRRVIAEIAALVQEAAKSRGRARRQAPSPKGSA